MVQSESVYVVTWISSLPLAQLRVQPLSFIQLHSAALLARGASQLAALLLTLLRLQVLSAVGGGACGARVYISVAPALL